MLEQDELLLVENQLQCNRQICIDSHKSSDVEHFLEMGNCPLTKLHLSVFFAAKSNVKQCFQERNFVSFCVFNLVTNILNVLS